jgi:hypothetical protein
MMPDSRNGKIGFWLASGSFVYLHLQYWYAIWTSSSITPWLGILPLLGILIGGIYAIIAILQKERAILVHVPLVLCLWVILIVAGGAIA